VIRAWRIVESRHAPDAFDGEGASLFGGRWNSPGTRMIYTSSTAALAILEMLVHLNRALALPSYVLIRCDFDDALVSNIDRSLLPANWRSYPAPPQLQAIGDEWVKSGSSAVLKVPSAVIERESNYLLNPEHQNFSRVKIYDPEPLALDLRLVK
jgi:RES domain-containing protein